MSSLSIGLTGGLASGKSTVGRRMRDAGYRVVDADRLVAELYEPGREGSAAVSDLFGPSYLEDSGAVDRQRLAELVFSDDEARQRLEAAVHPLVRDGFAEIARNTSGVVVLEATLLVEAGFAFDFDLIVTVEADDDKRLARAIDRGLEPDDARHRLRAQGTGDERRASADVVLRNDGSLESFLDRIDDLIRDIDDRVKRAS